MEEFQVDADLDSYEPAVYDAATNMALDEHVLERAGAEEVPYLRIYGFEEPSFIPSRRTSTDDLAAYNYDVTRRETNGSTIPCLGNGVAYSVAYPTNDFPDRVFEDRVAPALVEALEAVGVETDDLNVCVKHDSVRYGERETPKSAAEGETLVGSSLWRRDGAVLSHGVIAAEPWDAEFLDENMELREGERAFIDSLPSVEQAGEYDEQSLVSGLLEGFTEGDCSEADLGSSDVEELLEGKYRDEDWIYSGSESGRGHCFVEEEGGEFY